MPLDGPAPTSHHRLVKLGAAIKAALASQRKPQEWLAQQLNMSASQVSRIVKGKAGDLQVERVAQIEDVLGLKRGELLRAGGYVGDAPTVREMLAIDPDLELSFRAEVAAYYEFAFVRSEQARQEASAQAAASSEPAERSSTSPSKRARAKR